MRSMILSGTSPEALAREVFHHLRAIADWLVHP